jgi:hypothetical protein
MIFLGMIKICQDQAVRTKKFQKKWYKNKQSKKVVEKKGLKK